MKFKLKNAFFSILILLAIPLVIALFIDNEYRVENEILIQQPKAEVFTYVNPYGIKINSVSGLLLIQTSKKHILEQTVPLDLFLHGKAIIPK